MDISPLSRVKSAISGALASWSNEPAPATEAGTPDEARLSGATFAEQEPDLAKEAGVTGRAISGWAMAGSSLPD